MYLRGIESEAFDVVLADLWLAAELEQIWRLHGTKLCGAPIDVVFVGL